MARHPAGAPAHQNAAEWCGNDVHRGAVEGELADRHAAIREELIVFLGGGNQGIAERQSGLGQCEDYDAGSYLVPRQRRDVQERKLESRREACARDGASSRSRSP